MDLQDVTSGVDDAIDSGLDWISSNLGWLFDAVRFLLEHLFQGLAWGLQLPPFPVVALLVGLVGWWAVGLRFAVMAAIGLAFCAMMGLWPEMMQTLALVLAATVLALLIAVPIGVLAGFVPSLHAVLTPVLDMVQTLPPYIYLLPAIALLGFGPATAMVATVIVAIPPALRLTALGIRLTPLNFIELGQASGSSPAQMFFKIRLPFALPSIMAGVNQCLMMSFGMVVIAGIVGSGGLGTAIYDAVRTLNIGKSIDAAIAIVILTMILDRISEGAVKRERKAR